MSLIAKLFRKPFRRLVRGRGFAADDRGTTAIEFGLLGIPFFGLLAAILETAYVFLAGQILDTAVQDASRFIRTGQVQAKYANNVTNQRDAITDAICDGLYGLFDCDQLWITVETVTQFTGITRPSPLPADCSATNCDWATGSSYASTKASEVVLVRVYYKWPTFINIGGFTLQNTGGNSRLLGAVRLFRNEPF
jgi:Flp pilus assembly protein TadG